jgi:hypothetical protein
MAKESSRTMKKLNVLIACEFSGAVRYEFRRLGHNAWSCDLEPSDSEYHIQDDVLNHLNRVPNSDRGWDLMIAHPPCTYLTVTGNRWFHPKYADKFPDRPRQREEAAEFFMDLYNADIPHIAVENPIGVMSTRFRKPDQIIQPWQFGDEAQKSTCLWLKNLPLLEHTDVVGKGEFMEWTTSDGKKKRQPKWYADALKKNPKEREKIRNTTFPGIAKAIAEQYSNYLTTEYEI